MDYNYKLENIQLEELINLQKKKINELIDSNEKLKKKIHELNIIKEEQMNTKIDKIDTILELLKNQQRTQKKLEEHIDFVESTYDTLKSPLNFVKDRINSFTGSTTRRQLPDFPRQITQTPV